MHALRHHHLPLCSSPTCPSNYFFFFFLPRACFRRMHVQRLTLNSRGGEEPRLLGRLQAQVLV